jgi:ADP-heptose:LPS heptosyltransferase
MDTIPEKMWPTHHFSTCLREFLRLRSDFIVMLVGLGNRQLGLGRYNYRLIECRGLSMATTFALVARSDLFFGIDSCMLHMADLARVPGVAIFGPTSAVEFGFRLSRSIALQGRTSTDEIYPENALSALLRLSDNSCRVGGQEVVVT